MTVEQSKHIEQVTTEVLGNVPDLRLVPVQSVCSSRSGGASGNSGPGRCPLRLNGRFFVLLEFTGIQGKPTFSWRVELVASSGLRYWCAPFGSEHESVGFCMWKPRLWFLIRLLVACLSSLRLEASSLLG